MYTTFDRIIHTLTPLPEEKLKDAVEIIQNGSLQTLLDFCVSNGCLTQEQATIIFHSMIRWEALEDAESSYYEFEDELLFSFYDSIGVSGNVFEIFAESEEDEEDEEDVSSNVFKLFIEDDEEE